MITIRTFRTILLILVGCTVVGSVAVILSRHSLPPELQTYKNAAAAAERAAGVINHVQAVVAAILMVAYVVAIIGLYRFRPFAKPLFAGYLALSFILVLFFGPSVETRFISSCENLSTLIQGVVLALLYWSPIRENFTRPTTVG